MRNPAQILVGLTLATTLTVVSGHAQAQPAEAKANFGAYQILYLNNLTQTNDANDITNDLRNMLPNAKIYYVQSQSAITMRGSAEDVALAQKIIADLDKPRRSYRLTYTITETDGGKPIGAQHFAVVVLLGGRTVLKQGSKVPLVTGSTQGDHMIQNSQVQYMDVGWNIEASLDGYLDGLRLRTKIEQSKVADEKSGMGAQDPVFRQTTLDATSTLAPGKPVVLGTMDVLGDAPGSTRKQEIEVVSELVK